MSQTSSRTASQTTRRRISSPGWWIRDRDGEVALAQLPNPALGAWLLATVVHAVAPLDDRRSAALTLLGRGALAAWALDEVIRGASPARRLVGLVVLPLVVWRSLA